MKTAEFEALWAKAYEASRVAHAAAVPEPMVVVGGGNRWFVPDGPCGFGWVTFSGATPFGRWAKKTGRARPHYPKGLYVSTNGNSQSIARAEAAAYAFAKVLREAGIEARGESRLD